MGRIAPCPVLCWDATVPAGRPSSVTLDLSGTWDLSAVAGACGSCGIGTASPATTSIVMTYVPQNIPNHDAEYYIGPNAAYNVGGFIITDIRLYPAYRNFSKWFPDSSPPLGIDDPCVYWTLRIYFARSVGTGFGSQVWYQQALSTNDPLAQYLPATWGAAYNSHWCTCLTGCGGGSDQIPVTVPPSLTVL
jgi:hypothetical protein